MRSRFRGPSLEAALGSLPMSDLLEVELPVACFFSDSGVFQSGDASTSTALRSLLKGRPLRSSLCCCNFSHRRSRRSLDLWTSFFLNFCRMQSALKSGLARKLAAINAASICSHLSRMPLAAFCKAADALMRRRHSSTAECKLRNVGVSSGRPVHWHMLSTMMNLKFQGPSCLRLQCRLTASSRAACTKLPVRRSKSCSFMNFPLLLVVKAPSFRCFRPEPWRMPIRSFLAAACSMVASLSAAFRFGVVAVDTSKQGSK
mmetsp:Transcript_27909/g.64854  ORF Transcript_27909/g.64854 Transcript_27909/m.64854 type:complete len:259 (-) Transcript_27909:120-896(-)